MRVVAAIDDVKIVRGGIVADGVGIDLESNRLLQPVGLAVVDIYRALVFIGDVNAAEIVADEHGVRMRGLDGLHDFAAGQVEDQDLARFFGDHEQAIAGAVDAEMIEASFHRRGYLVFGGQFQRRGRLREGRRRSREQNRNQGQFEAIHTSPFLSLWAEFVGRICGEDNGWPRPLAGYPMRTWKRHERELQEPSLRKNLRRLPQAPILELQPQRKLDFALVIIQLPVDPAPLRFFRERGVTCITIEYKRVDTRSAEAGMIEDIEELRSELQHASFSQESDLCIFDSRKVPIPFRGPAQEVPSGVAKLANGVRAIG